MNDSTTQQAQEPGLKYKTQQMLLDEVEATPDKRPTEEVLEFTFKALGNPVAAMGILAIQRLLKVRDLPEFDARSRNAIAFAEAMVEDFEKMVEDSMVRDPSRLFETVAKIFKGDKA